MTRRYFKLSPKTKRFTVRCLTIAFFLFKKIIGAIISVIFFFNNGNYLLPMLAILSDYLFDGFV